MNRHVVGVGRLVVLVFMALNLLITCYIALEIRQTAYRLNSYVRMVDRFLSTLPGYGSLWHVELPSFDSLYFMSSYIVLLATATLFMSYWLYQDGVNMRRLQILAKEKAATLVKKCPKCGKEVTSDLFNCPYCGFKLKKLICSRCKNEVLPEFKVCPYCGNKLS